MCPRGKKMHIGAAAEAARAAEGAAMVPEGRQRFEQPQRACASVSRPHNALMLDAFQVHL